MTIRSANLPRGKWERNLMDVFTKAKRSQIMQAVRGKDTRPELIVRRLVHALGYRFRLHVRMLPGCPDLVFTGRKKVIFVHGCFWHRHTCRKGRSFPSTRLAFWRKKFDDNKRRNALALRALRRLGWSALVIWECEAQDKNIISKIRSFLCAVELPKPTWRASIKPDRAVS